MQSRRILPVFILLLPTLAGCMGGTLGQQLARSLVIQGADKVTELAVDAQLTEAAKPRQYSLKGTEPDPYLAAFLLAQIPEIKPEIIVEPLPDSSVPVPEQQGIRSSRLVKVEVWNLIVGREKHTMLQRSLSRGSAVLPAPVEWSEWQLAAGGLENHQSTPLYFLLPPHFGRVKSGDKAIIEIAGAGGLHVARHRAE